MLLKDFVNKKMASADKEASAEGVPLVLNNCKKYKKMRDLKVYGNCFQSTLPYPYQSVEYIGVTGGEYINTEYTPIGKLTIEGKFNVPRPTREIAIVGTEVAGWELGFSANQNRMFSFLANGTSVAVTPTNSIYDTILEFKAINDFDNLIRSLSVNIDNTDSSDYNVSENYKQNLLLFSYRKYYTFKGKCYNIKFYDNDTLVRDFIPCYNVETNDIGMYDTVNSAFYSNKGEGVFIKGPNTAPTPENPIEVQCVGEKSRNLFDFENASILGISSVKYNKTSDSYILSLLGTSTGNLKIYFGKADDFIGKTLTMSVECANNIGSTYTQLIMKTPDGVILEGNAIGGDSVYEGNRRISTINVSEEHAGNDIAIRLYVYNPNNASGLNIEYKNIQVEPGPTANDFIPYGKYRVPIVQRGNNLLGGNIYSSNMRGITCDYEGDGIFHLYGEFTNDGASMVGLDMYMLQDNIPLETTSYYTLYAKVISGSTNLGFYVYTGTGSSTASHRNWLNVFIPADTKVGTTLYKRNTANFNLSDTTYMDWFKIYPVIGSGKTLVADIRFQVWLVEDESPTTPYEPYVEPITTILYLDEPLRKIGTYADYIDGKNDKVIRSIQKLDAERMINSHGIQVYKNEGLGVINCYRLYNPFVISVNAWESRTLINSNMLPYGGYVGVGGRTSVGISEAKWLYFRFDAENNYGITDVSTLKNWLIQDNVVVNYVLNTPIEEPLNIELPKLNAKTTIIEVDASLAPSNISGKYIIR